MSFVRLIPNFIRLDNVDSTNSFAAGLLRETSLVNGTAIIAKVQTNGKGQRGSHWETESDKNLTCTVVINSGAQVDQLFYLNIISALAVCEMLKDKMSDVTIKWPNDILVGRKKISGILVENQIRAGKVATSMIGVGININQVEFPNLINVCSLKSCLGQDFSVDEIFRLFYSYLDFYVNLLMEQNTNQLLKLYHQNLFGMNTILKFEDSENVFDGVIKGIDENGKLKIQKGEVLKKYDLKEVKFLL